MVCLQWSCVRRLLYTVVKTKTELIKIKTFTRPHAQSRQHVVYSDFVHQHHLRPVLSVERCEPLEQWLCSPAVLRNIACIICPLRCATLYHSLILSACLVCTGPIKSLHSSCVYIPYIYICWLQSPLHQSRPVRHLSSRLILSLFPFNIALLTRATSASSILYFILHLNRYYFFCHCCCNAAALAYTLNAVVNRNLEGALYQLLY